MPNLSLTKAFAFTSDSSPTLYVILYLSRSPAFSFVLGIKKDEIKRIVILEYMKSVLWCNLIAVIPSVLGLFILNYFSCKFDSSIQFISYNPFMISVIIILQSLVTYIFWNKTINEIELNNLFGWMKRG